MNKEKLQDIIKSQTFIEFVNREFDQTISYATIEELADFAYGGIEEAIKAFIEAKGTIP